MAFVKKVDEIAEEKVEGDQVPSDVHKVCIDKFGKFCEEYTHFFPSDLPKGLPQRG